MLENSAYNEGLAAAACHGRDAQRQLGQYMTPPAIARFMARQCASGLAQGLSVVRLLEPAAGSGVLIATMVSALCEQAQPPKRIEVLAFEIDVRMHAALRTTCVSCAEQASALGIELVFELRCEDFLLAPMCLAQQPAVDLVIANPPYFKLNASDPRATAHRHAVFGQPNVYGLFMVACASVLKPGGRWCFITPRSWTSGPYFKAVRRQLLARLRLDAIHFFESRKNHFEDDAVLQEAMVTWGTAAPAGNVVLFSSSVGQIDIETRAVRALPLHAVVRGPELLIALPSQAEDPAALPWRNSLGSLGLRVATGPTVAFRHQAHLSQAPAPNHVPLLWMQHVQRMRVAWPLGRKHEHIAANAQTAWMLLHNGPLVVLRRFAPKEDVRRLVAAAYLGGLPGEFFGLENHLNYIHRPGGSMSPAEVKGLAAVLNSARVDAYVRSVSGNTQVNAAELREMPLPGWPQILDIAHRLADDTTDLGSIDAVIAASSIEVIAGAEIDLAEALA